MKKLYVYLSIILSFVFISCSFLFDPYGNRYTVEDRYFPINFTVNDSKETVKFGLGATAQ